MAYNGKKRAYKKRNYRRRRGASTRKAPKVSNAVRSYVRRAIHSNLENKLWTTYAANQSITTAGSSNFIYPINLLPVLQQGTGKSQRIGTEITMRTGTIKGRINLLPYSAVTNPNPSPALVKMWLISYRVANQPTMTSTTTYATFFDAGNSAVPPQGNVLDTLLEVNNDVWKVHATRSFKLSTTAAGASFGTGSNYDTGSISVPYSFSYGKLFSKLKYDDNITNITNKNLHLLIQVVNADGTLSSGYAMAETHYSVAVKFEDA